ncbi:KTR5 [Candida pseudojiufengensis]|uniref:KTR5 n=1 Tax=Candida pseudojiufengensis TaxID=497109 RepID=UPI00222517FF|nr:KTR5 [Candida pseudojiufengensis]KAI5962336.1 KTR5 [Candida pseudojiufengensis]
MVHCFKLRQFSPQKLKRSNVFLLSAFTVFIIFIYINSELILPNTDPFWLNYKIKKEPKYIKESKLLSDSKLHTNIDSPFIYGCSTPNPQEKANAAFVMLCRNSEVEKVVSSIRSMERHFNQWFKYPWIFLNNEEFTLEFQNEIKKHTSDAKFGKIDMKDWDFNPDIDKDEFHEWIESQGDREILYGNLKSYHKMCRFYAGQFFLHPLVTKLDWYWRVEPDVEFYCDLTYDPFLEMEKNGKKYGFNVMLADLYYSIPGLFRYVSSYIKKNDIKVKSAWKLFTLNSNFITGGSKQDRKNLDGIHDGHEILYEIQDQLYVKKLIHEIKNKDEKMFKNNFQIFDKIFAISKKMPNLYEDRINNEDYNLCHFWSNFEIARVDLFKSKEYQDFFKYLDESGGFYKERWGDAPVHSLAIGMLLDLNEIHYFRDIGYRHDVFSHCPSNAVGKQLPYTGDSFIRPDKPKFNGVGCRCQCPKTYDEIENSDCMRKWEKFIQDDYRDNDVIDVDRWTKRIDRKIKHHLRAGGKVGDNLV